MKAALLAMLLRQPWAPDIDPATVAPVEVLAPPPANDVPCPTADDVEHWKRQTLEQALDKEDAQKKVDELVPALTASQAALIAAESSRDSWKNVAEKRGRPHYGLAVGVSAAVTALVILGTVFAVHKIEQP